MNTNIQEIKLGAPATIECGAAPNAELSVQVASRIKNLTLHDEDSKCTSDGAIVTTAKLLRQKMEESSIQQSTWEGMTAHYGDNLADVIANGGNLLLSVHDADGNFVKAYWEIAEIIEAEDGATATITQDGLLALTEGKKIQGKVRAMNWDNSMEQVIFSFAEVCSSAALTIDKKYLKLLMEYPAFIHSLADTDKRNFIQQKTGPDAGYIDTGIVCSIDMSFDAIVRSDVHNGGDNYIFLGNGTTVSSIWLMHNYQSPNKRVLQRYFNTNNETRSAVYNEGWHQYKHDANMYSIDNSVINRQADVSTFVETAASPIIIFGGRRSSIATVSVTRNTQIGNIIDIERLTIRKNEEVHTFLPFVRKDEVGLIDLYDLSFYKNAHTTGSFDIITENKE